MYPIFFSIQDISCIFGHIALHSLRVVFLVVRPDLLAHHILVGLLVFCMRVFVKEVQNKPWPNPLFFLVFLCQFL